MALLLADLGVLSSHSRPYVSNDNPYSEAQFKTVKYCPQFPDRFGSIQDARAFCGNFFDYYNTEHRHLGIGLMTPAAVHYGLAEQLRTVRQTTLLAAYRAHPERFVRRPPQPPILPRQAWINPPPEKSRSENGAGALIVCSTPDSRAVVRRVRDRGGTCIRCHLDIGACSLNANAKCLKTIDTFRLTNLQRCINLLGNDLRQTTSQPRLFELRGRSPVGPSRPWIYVASAFP